MFYNSLHVYNALCYACVCVCVCVYVLCVLCVLCDSTGTVVSEDSIAQAVQQFKTSREFKCDKIGNIHLYTNREGICNVSEARQ